MNDTPEFGFPNDASLNAEFAALEGATSITNGLEGAAGRELTIKERELVMNALMPGLTYFHELAIQAGRLAGEGDPLGAISLMGGEANARELIGDENVDELLAQAEADLGDMAPADFGSAGDL